MIKFAEKTYSEFDAMRQLYVEMSKRYKGYDGKPGFKVINASYLPGILKGNSVVIEKFVIQSRFIGRDKYRMYIKIGAKAKLPDDVRLPYGRSDNLSLGRLDTKIYPGVPLYNRGKGNKKSQDQSNKSNNSQSSTPSQQDSNRKYTLDELRDLGLIKGGFDRKEKRNSEDSNKDKTPKFGINQTLSTSNNLQLSINRLLGDSLLYDKKTRSLVLEFNSIGDAVEALNVLPFGVNYELYLLN